MKYNKYTIEDRLARLERYVMESKQFERVCFITVILFYVYLGLHLGYLFVSVIF